MVLELGQSNEYRLVRGSLLGIDIVTVVPRLWVLLPSVGDTRGAVRGVILVCEVVNMSLSNKLSVRNKQKQNKTKQNSEKKTAK